MEQSTQKPVQPGSRSIHHEWRTAENSGAYLLPKLQFMKESNPQLTLLDVGAGSGTISMTFAKAIPNGRVTATDLNDSILERAAAIAESADVKNIDFQQADAYSLPFADDTFDITHCYQMLCHLKEPWDVLREMLRVTKPEGLVAAREGDLETECVWPELPGLLKFHQMSAGIISSGGGSITAGRQLLSWALRTGVRREQITVILVVTTSIADGIVKMVRSGRDSRMVKAGLDSGLFTDNDLDEEAKAWEEWVEREDATLGMMHGEIIIQK